MLVDEPFQFLRLLRGDLLPAEKGGDQGEEPPGLASELRLLGPQGLLPSDFWGDGGRLVLRRPLVDQAAEHRVGGALAPVQPLPAQGHQVGGVDGRGLPQQLHQPPLPLCQLFHLRSLLIRFI